VTPDDDQGKPLPDHEPNDVASLGAEREAHAELLHSLRHRIRHHAVEARRRQQQGDEREGGEHPEDQPIARQLS